MPCVSRALVASLALHSTDALTVPADSLVGARGGVIVVPLMQRVADTRAGLSFLQVEQAPGDGQKLGSSGAPVMDVYAQISVGSPKKQTFNVLLDTGSGNILLTSRLCRSIGCMAHKPYDGTQSQSGLKVEVHNTGGNKTSMMETSASTDTVLRDIVVGLATGEAEGSFTQDVVCLGGAESTACASTSFVEMTKMSAEPWDQFPYDGVLGLGLPSASLASNFNFLGNLAEGGKLLRNRFAVWLKGDYDDEPSQVSFGDFDEKRLGSEILWMPVVDQSVGQWRVNMTDAVVQGTNLNLCGKEGCKAVFDTGTSVIAGPESFIKGILGKLNIQSDCSNYDALPPLGFGFRMYSFSIEKQDYVQRVGSKCHPQFLQIDTPPPKGPAIFLGNPFMKKYLTIFDRESLKVGIALSVHKNRPGVTESLSAVAARLIVPKSA